MSFIDKLKGTMLSKVYWYFKSLISHSGADKPI